MRQDNLHIPAVGAICDKPEQGHPKYHVDADDDCRMNVEQVALVGTAGFKSVGGEGLRTKPAQSVTCTTISFATVRSIYVQSGNIFTPSNHTIECNLC